MDQEVIKLGIMAVAAAISGFFLFGFLIYTIYAVINWHKKRKQIEKIWGGLTGIAVNSLIFVLTFPTVFSFLREALGSVIDRFL